MYSFGRIQPWWTNEHRNLTYKYRPLATSQDIDRWITQGYPAALNFNGEDYNMQDLKSFCPFDLDKFFVIFPWDHIGISFCRMNTGDVLPLHQDHYIKYREVYNINDPTQIRRAIVFLEDWASGHYFEIGGKPFVNWTAGDYVYWSYDTPHFAGNFGIEPRYTLQITGIEK